MNKAYGTEHWMDTAMRKRGTTNPSGHTDKIRVSAESIVRLMDLKNELEGRKASIAERNEIAVEQNEQVG